MFVGYFSWWLQTAHHTTNEPGPVFSYKLRYIVGFWLIETAVSTNQKPTMYRNLYENTGPDIYTGAAPLHIYCAHGRLFVPTLRPYS